MQDLNTLQAFSTRQLQVLSKNTAAILNVNPPKSLFKISARVGKKRFEVGCKAQNAAIAGYGGALRAQQSAQIRSLDHRAKILNSL
ncbi:hypothetical protein [Vandammella animalimorsus]|uniref:hypothetical protein n=1 Tax=Vandammella animalimorsus TaxID=2029117 RepID=UPI000BAA8ECE|nr:hypothetical protein [Vandammella animalimorsus]